MVFCCGQVSDTPPEGEDEGSGLSEGSGKFEGSGLFEGSGEEVEGSGLNGGGDEEEEEEVMLYFYLEESTGYMQPTLAFLAMLHTIIAFICIIGYNCLKVHKAQKKGKKIFNLLYFRDLFQTFDSEQALFLSDPTGDL